jgi:hypothetical protein
VNASERIYRWLLRLYPRDFREEYGHEMSLLFRARATSGSASLWFQVLGDLLFHAPQERWSTTKQDLRYAVRQLRRSPGFSAVVISTLAVGIGGTTAVFSVMHAVLLAPLPYLQPGELVRIYQQEPDNPASRRHLSAPHFRTLRDQAASFVDVSARYFRDDMGLDLASGGNPQRLRVLLVTYEYFRTLRAEPFRGPGLQIEDEAGEARDDRIGARRVVLSDVVWRARFNGDPSIVGKTIRISAEPYEVAGIAPAGFEDPVVGAVDAWVPYNLKRDTITENYSLTVVGRLRTGVSVKQTLAELAVLMTIETGPLAGTAVKQLELREHRTVSGEFFNALAIPVLAGRTFDGRDDAAASMRAVISANLARAAFPGMPLDKAVGQRIRVLTRQGTREIIGVVGDVTIDVYGKPSGAVYTAHRQFAANRNWGLTHVVATDGPAERIVPEVRAVVASMDPELVVYRPMALTEVVGRGHSRERFALMLMAAFAAVSLTLAALGLYGILAYAVRRRTPEIGIRIALGATRAQIRLTVLKQASLVLGTGLVAGTVGALVLGRWLTSFAFGISPSDPRILLSAAVLLTMTGLLAAWLPARRAARVEPRIAIQDAY